MFDRQGRLQTTHAVPVASRHPAPERVEHDPEEILASVVQAAAGAESAAGAIHTAGLAVQRSSVVCWDNRSGAPLSNVISWQDRRACRSLAAMAADAARIHALTGLVLSPHYGAGKLRWCLEQLPAVAAAARTGHLAFGPLASFLTFRLIGTRPLVVDPANAARTLLWNLKQRDWDPELLKLFGIPGTALPRCVPTAYAYGRLRLNHHNPPLTVLNGDQNAALFADGAPDINTVYVNLGTGAFLQRVLPGEGAPHPRLLTEIAYQGPRRTVYVREGTVNGAGSALDWAAARLELDREEVDRQLDRWLAQAVSPPLFLNGVSGLGSPYWRASFPSRFLGGGAPETRLVAVVESILFLAMENLVLLNAGTPATRIVVSGGLANVDGLCQRLANLSGLVVERPAVTEATARGTAYLAAGLPAGWESPPRQRFRPAPDAELKARYRRWQAAMEQALAPRGPRLQRRRRPQ